MTEESRPKSNEGGISNVMRKRDFAVMGSMVLDAAFWKRFKWCLEELGGIRFKKSLPSK